MAGIPPYAWLAGSAFLFGIGDGAMNPASRNAGLQMAPEKSTVHRRAALHVHVDRPDRHHLLHRPAIIASTQDSGHTQAWIYFAAAVVPV